MPEEKEVLKIQRLCDPKLKFKSFQYHSFIEVYQHNYLSYHILPFEKYVLSFQN